jgi:uncharacterized protein DUF2155
MKRLFLAVISVTSLTMLFACGGGKQAPPQAGAPPQGGQGQQQARIPPMGKPVVAVPEAVKGKWKGVTLVIMDKEKKSTKEYFAGLGEKLKVPGSDITVEVKEYFPSFVMQGSNITSSSNEDNNPAAQVVVTEGGAEIFSGWLFARYPTTHAFAHPKYTITLKEGVKK